MQDVRKRDNHITNNMKVFDFGLFKVSRVKGREVAVVVDQTKIPTEFIKVTENVSVNKTELLKYLKGGISVSGAEITCGKSSLRIK